MGYYLKIKNSAFRRGNMIVQPSLKASANTVGLNMNERDQLVTFSKLKDGLISQSAAAKILNFSVRWVRKKFKRFIEFGAKGLIHQRRNKPSPKAWDSEEKEFAMKLFEGPFQDFGPTFAAEKLEELYRVKINRETLRQAMISYGHWHGRKRKPKHRKWRERKEHFGTMIQLDGSPHDWFEGRAPKCTLLVFIDDATSSIVHAELAPSESTESLMVATRYYVEQFGRPLIFYVDFGGVFSVNINNPDRIKITQFKRACNEIGIDVKYAHSPQAKGRVERSNGTHQDRLIKEFRLHNISTIAEANKFIVNTYIPAHNRRFAVKPAKSGDVHRPLTMHNLDNIFCLKEERIIQNDFTVQYKNRILQLLADQKAVIRPKESVIIHEHFDKTLSIFIRSIQLNFTEISKRPLKLIEPVFKQHKIHKPAANHPWRVYSAVTKSKHPNGGY